MTTTTVCGIQIGKLSKFWQFFIYTTGVFVCYLINGLVSEAIFRVPGFQTFGWFLTLFQYFFYVVCSYSEFQREETSARVRVPLKSYVLLALLTVLTMGMSNASVGYMNYPTQLVFKSCKVPFVMVGAIVLQGKRYDFYEFLAALVMTFGLISFTMVDSTVSPNFETKIYHTYTLGFVVIFCITVFTGELIEALKFSKENQSEIMPLLVLFSATGYLGINFVLALILSFGSVWAVTVTTLRKTLTICLSFVIFEKNFSVHYIWSGLLVILGIYMNGRKQEFLAFCKVFNRRILSRSKVGMKKTRSQVECLV